MKRIALVGSALAVLAIVAGLIAWAMRGQIAVRLMARMYDHAMGADPLAGVPDGLDVGLCGSGSPMPDPTRAGPCTVVVAGRRLFVADIGEGAAKTLLLMNLPPPMVSGLLITHFHSDHIADLGELMLQRWGGGAATSPLPVYGLDGRGSGGPWLRGGLPARRRLPDRASRPQDRAADRARRRTPPVRHRPSRSERHGDRR